MKRLLLVGVGLLAWCGLAEGRRIVDLTGSDWTADGAPVTVPHTWNVEDSCDGRSDGILPSHLPGWVQGDSIGMNGYARKCVTYSRDLPAPKAGRRYFLAFDGVSQKAAVRVNGRLVGRHLGAFTPFVFEITPYLKPRDNWLEVDADNRYDADLPPLDADFSVCGGLYRPVTLVETPATCIDPRVPVRAWPDPKTGEVRIEYAVGGEPRSVMQKVEGFELWSPENPKLYTLTVREGDDEVSVRIGFRTVEMREDGFYLNGVRRKIRGVNRHQDVGGKGWAVSPEDEERDIRMIKEMGADGLRLAHYPQSAHIYDLCDELGLLVWSEVPMVNKITLSEDFLVNARTMAREMVEWRGNHACIAWWSVFNEIYNGSNHMKSGFFEPTLEIVAKDMRRLDPTRPVGGVTCVWDRPQLNAIPDVLGFNFYPAWYENCTLSEKLSDFFRLHPTRKTIGLTEYGAGASINHHANPPPKWFHPTTPFHPEEYQTRGHMTVYRDILGHDDLWGTFVWAMFDFAADARAEGELAGINDKGLVTRDRRVRKDAFYLYKANWSKVPLLHLTGKRLRETTSGKVEVVAFSNLGRDVTLKVNGKVVATASPDEIASVRFADVPLAVGANAIEVSSGGLVDACTWTRLADPRDGRPLKVLMIGNSFSICVLKDMPAVAADLGLKLDLCSLYIGGCSLERHMKNMRAPETSPYKVTWSYVDAPEDEPPFKGALVWGEKTKDWRSNVTRMLAADRWDVVTIQQASHESWRPESYEPHGTELIAEIRRLAPQAKICVQETWSYTPWDNRFAEWGIDQDLMDERLESAYAAFAERHGLERIRMGKAVRRYRRELPVRYGEKANEDDVCGVGEFAFKDGRWRPSGDVFHLNARGEYLQALVWTASLFDVDVIRSAYRAKAMEGRTAAADLMRRVASEVRR